MPRTFKDNAGREWSVELNVSALKRVRSIAGVDLGETNAAEVLADVMNDAVVLCDVLYAVCKPQLDAATVPREAFEESFSGNMMASASGALTDAIVDFCRSPELRAALGQMATEARRIQEEAFRSLAAAVQDGSIVKAMREAASGATSTPSPASSA